MMIRAALDDASGARVACAVAPACVGNVGVGFDLLGHTFFGPGDLACVRRAEPGVTITAVHGDLPGVADIPLDARANTAGRALQALIEVLDLPFGFSVELHKGIPLGSGMGGSAASAVAALVAANALLDAPLDAETLYPYALRGESASTDAAPGDNVGPMLTGGLAMAARQVLLPLQVPLHWYCVVLRPAMAIETRRAREVLEAPFALDTCVTQSTHLGLFLTGIERASAPLVRMGLKDVLVEPRRAQLVPGFHAIQSAAVAAGAMGASLSGSGPALFAWFESEAAAREGETAMRAAAQPWHASFESWVSPVAGPAARVVTPAAAHALIEGGHLHRDAFQAEAAEERSENA